MYKVLLVNDISTINNLKVLFSTYYLDLEVVGTTSSLNEAYALIENKQPQLVFLNTELMEELSFEWLDRLSEIFFQIIFIANKDCHAIKAINYNPAGYLMTPITTKDLIRSVHKAIKWINLETENSFHKALWKKGTPPTNSLIGIPTLNGIEFIDIKSMIRCEGLRRCTRIFLTNQKMIISSHNLGVFKKLLGEDDFFSPHKSHIINLNYIQTYQKEGVINLKDGSCVPIARRKKQEFMSKIIHL